MTWGAPDWTPEITAALRTLWAEGHSTAEIGRRLGVSKNAVVGKAHRLDLPGRPSPIRRDATRPAPSLPAARVTGPTLPPLPSLATPAWNAKPPPPPETRALVVRLLTEGRSNVLTAADAGLTIDEVRKIRGTIEVPKRERPIVAPKPKVETLETRRRPIDEPKEYSRADMEFRKRSREYPASYHVSNVSIPFGERFVFGKQLERRQLTGHVPTAADIAAHIARHGVTQCPTAAASATTASIPAHDQMAVAAYQQARDEDWAARNAPRNKRGMMAAKRAAEMRR